MLIWNSKLSRPATGLPEPSAARRSAASAPWAADMPRLRPAFITIWVEAAKEAEGRTATAVRGMAKRARLGQHGFEHQLVGCLERGLDPALEPVGRAVERVEGAEQIDGGVAVGDHPHRRLDRVAWRQCGTVAGMDADAAAAPSRDGEYAHGPNPFDQGPAQGCHDFPAFGHFTGVSGAFGRRRETNAPNHPVVRGPRPIPVEIMVTEALINV